MTVAKPEQPGVAVAYHGHVSEPPKAPGDPFTALIPGFDDTHVFEIRRYESRGGAIPAEGDEVLVVMDDVSEPWATTWSSLSEEEGGEYVKGPESATDGALAAFNGTTGKLIKEAGPITSEMIEAIEAAKITGQIVETQIGPEAVTTPKLAAGSVTAAKIVAGTITATQIAAATIVAGNIAAGTITATQIKAGTITGTLIAAETLEAGKLKAGTITAKQVAAGTITATQIAANTITAGQIAAGTITATEIAANTITAGNILANTITAAQIASGTITGGNIASGTVTASNITIAKLSALSADLGTITAGTVTGATLRTSAAGSRVVIDSEGLHAFNATEGVLDFNIATGNLSLKGEVKAGSTIPASTVTGELTDAQIKEITAAKITGSITETQVGAEAITTPKLAAGAVTAAKITANTITAGQIAAGTITSTEIAAATIKGTNIAAATIETSNLKAGAITAEKIAALTITGSQIAANTIAAGKLSVSTLSAITANLGTITAGTITGAKISALESFTLPEGTAETPLAGNSLKWINTEGIAQAEIYANNTSKFDTTINLNANRAKEREEGRINLLTVNKSGERANIKIWSRVAATKQQIEFEYGTGKSGLLINSEGESSFLQLVVTAKRKIHFGVSEVEWPGGNIASKYTKVTHKIGASPFVFGNTTTATGAEIEFLNITETTFEVRAVMVTGVNPAAGAKASLNWIAVG